MTFASIKLRIFMSIAVALLLFGIDRATNPDLATDMLTTQHPSALNKDAIPVIRLRMNDLCADCVARMTTALAKVPYVKMKPVPPHAPDASRPDLNKGDYASDVELEVADLSQVNFVVLDHALREAGLVAERIEVSGLRHFRLETKVLGFSEEARKGLNITSALRAQGHFQWLAEGSGQLAFDEQRNTIVAYVGTDRVADVQELITVLNHLGYQPYEVFALSAPEQPSPLLPKPN